MNTATNGVKVVNVSKYKEGVLYSTTNYAMFHRLPENREISESHVSEIIAEIDEYDLLAENPIIVNEHFGIADGQHTWKAAEVMQRPLYFIIHKGITVEQARRLGHSTKEWTIKDDLESFIKGGNKEYMKIKEFALNYKISIPIALAILAGEYQHRPMLVDRFRRGKFVINDFERADTMASFLTELRLYSIDSAWKDRRFMRAVNNYLADGRDPKRVIKKIKDYGLSVSKRKSVGEYEVQLEHILEFKA